MKPVVYKQRYFTRTDPRTAKSNTDHLKYISTRKGVIQNPGCGFGLWGRMGADAHTENINNLKQTMRQMYDVSKSHTVYRAVISLDEETALQKGFTGRDEWQALITSRAEVVAKENDIDIKDFRWCAAYHHEAGHPHLHMMFWDNSDRVRNEYMGDERFAIASEKIRAAFNGDIFKEELRLLRGKQDAANKELRALSKNQVEGFEELTIFKDDSQPESQEDIALKFYPKNLRDDDAKKLAGRLEELVHVLPEKGQLKYQLLEPNVKAAVDAVSRLVIEQNPLLSKTRESLLDVAEDISITYDNSEASIKRSIRRADSRIFKDVGNDVLKTIKALGWLDERSGEREESLRMHAHSRVFDVAADVLQDKLQDDEFIAQYQQVLKAFPALLTPKHEVLKDAAVSDGLRALVLKLMDDGRLKNAIRVSQAFETKNTREADSQDSDAEDAPGDGDKSADTEVFKEVYRYLHGKLYDMMAQEKGYELQKQCLTANSFLHAFSKMFSRNNSLNGANGKFLLMRELSKQAKKERVLEMQSASKMWSAGF